MKLRNAILALGTAVALCAPLAFAGAAHSAPPDLQLVPDTSDTFRTTGCSGCFVTQVKAQLANFASIDRVFRLCGSGGGYTTATANDACNGGFGGGGNSQLLDYLVIQGQLKDSNNAANPGFGVPGGGAATVRISAGGSNVGIQCAGNGQGTGGFLAPEGNDGIPGTADDAGSNGIVANGFGVVGGGDANVGTANMVTPPLAACNAGLDRASEYLLPYPGGFGAAAPGGILNSNPTLPTTQLCVVNFDLDNNVAINGAPLGIAIGSGAVGPATATTGEATNLAVSCDTGFADVPTQDFFNNTFNADAFRNSDTYGAQIFKLIVNQNVVAKTDATKKVALAQPQIQNIFTGPGKSGSICSWDAAGAQAVGQPNDNIFVCFREDGSGTREVFRNTWMLESAGQKSTGTASGACNAQPLEAGGVKTSTKTMTQRNTGGDIATCVQSNPNAIGYVDVARSKAGTYAVPVLGVDPETNADIVTLVKCGMYPYWGPLAGGDGARNTGTNALANQHKATLKNLNAFPGNTNYIPLGTATTGVSYLKTRTNAPYGFKFIPTSCPGFLNPPNPAP